MVPGSVTQVMRWINWDIYVTTVLIGLLYVERETSEQTSITFGTRIYTRVCQ